MLAYKMKRRRSRRFMTRPRKRRRLGFRFRSRFRGSRMKVLMQSHRAVEKKNFDFSFTKTLDVNSSDVVHLTAIGQGTLPTERIGAKIALQSIAFRLSMKMTPTSTDTHDDVRVAIVFDRQQVSSTNPTTAMIWANGTDPLSFINTANFGRFGIIWTKLTQLTQPTLGSGAGNYARLYQGFIKFKKPVTIRYSGAAATAISKNGLYWAGMSNGVDTLGDAVFFTYRLRYTDA